MLNKLTTLLASAILVAGFATTAFAQGAAPAASHPQNPSPMQGQSMMNGLGIVTSGPEMMNGQNARNGRGMTNGENAGNGQEMMNGQAMRNDGNFMGGSMMGMMRMMVEMNRMINDCNSMMESTMRHPPSQSRHA